MGCRKSTKKFFLRMLCCKRRGKARDISIGRPTDFRREDPYNSNLDPDLLALIHEKATADSHRMVEEPLLRESMNKQNNNNHSNLGYDNHDVATANAPPRSSLRDKAKQQTRRLSLGLFVGNSGIGIGGGGGGMGGRRGQEEEEEEGLTKGASEMNSGSGSDIQLFNCNDFSDSARAGALRYKIGGGDDGMEAGRLASGLGLGLGLGLEFAFEAGSGMESDAEQRTMTGDTSASTF